MLKICPVCGKKWDAKGNSVYCSADCRAAGQHQKREEWKERTGFRSKQAAKARQIRARQRTEANARQSEANARRTAKEAAEAEEMRQRHIDQLKKQTAAGDDISGMLLAKINHDDIAYWQHFQNYEMSLCDEFENTRRTVNGISIFTDHFPEAVIESIKETGVIRIERSR